MMISGGFNVYAREVEDALHAHPAVAEVAVLGLPDAQWGEVVAAFVVRRPGKTVDADALARHSGELIAGYKKPRVIEFVDALPRNHAGKVTKNDLRDAYLARHPRRRTIPMNTTRHHPRPHSGRMGRRPRRAGSSAARSRASWAARSRSRATMRRASSRRANASITCSTPAASSEIGALAGAVKYGAGPQARELHAQQCRGGHRQDRPSGAPSSRPTISRSAAAPPRARCRKSGSTPTAMPGNTSCRSCA